MLLRTIVLIMVSLAIGCAAISVAQMPLSVARSGIYEIPQDYYNSTCQKPMNLTFYDWMATLQIPPYELDVFDCSQRAAYIEWLSENCGHRAVLVGAFGPGWGHIWTWIDIDGIPFAYEAGATTPWISREENTQYYRADTMWESIYEAPQERFEQEYAWWLTYPSLVTTEWR